MKILHLITNLNVRGADGVLCRLITAYKDNTHHLITLMEPGFHADRMIAAGVFVDTLRMPRGRVTLKGLKTLYRFIRTLDPDLVQTWMFHANLIGGVVARLAGKRAVVWGIRSSSHHPTRTSRSTRLVKRMPSSRTAWSSFASMKASL